MLPKTTTKPRNPIPMASSRRQLHPDSDFTPPVPDPKPYFPPDALPKPPIPINTPIPYSQPHSTHHQNVLILAMASVLAASFLLLSYYSLLLLFRRYRRHRRRALAQTPDAHPVLPGDEIHHVWYIRTVGLDESTIGSITICPYKKDEGLIDGTDCSVCLSEFRDGELVRLLPKCSHAFHISCIDTWLRSHVNCPLCRAPIVAPPVAVPVENTAASVVVEEGEGSEGGIGSSSESVVEESPVPVRGRIDDGDSARWNSVRRSVSMDFSGCKEGSPLKVPFGIERSMSTTGNKFLMSRLGRVHSASVLPL